MRNRDWRRAQRQLAIGRARDRAKVFGLVDGVPYRSERWVRESAVTPQPCSGPCCGNPRHHFGTVTLQEVRIATSLDEWLIDLGD